MNSSPNKRITPNESRTSTGADAFNRRSFLARVLAVNAIGLSTRLAVPEAKAAPGVTSVSASSSERRLQAYRIRQQAALFEFNQPVPAHPNNGDEVLYSNRMGSYSKGLPHDALGEVELNAYSALLTAVLSSPQRRRTFRVSAIFARRKQQAKSRRALSSEATRRAIWSDRISRSSFGWTSRKVQCSFRRSSTPDCRALPT